MKKRFCPICREMKEESEFHNSKTFSHGKSGWCKKCTTHLKYTTTCELLKEHHDNLKDDPEHLSCDFLKKIIGVDCK